MTNGKKRHNVIKNYVAENFETASYDILFDKAYEIKRIYGKETYDALIEELLERLGMKLSDMDDVMQSHNLST